MICKKCVMSDDIEGVKIDSDGLCNYCKWDEKMNKNYPISEIRLDEMVQHIKKEGEGKKYDAVIGVSGGCDSSILLKHMVDRDVRCLAVHWDNNWNTDIAWKNIVTLTKRYGVDLKVRHISRNIYDSLCISFLMASVPDADIPNDIALATVLYEEAEQHNISVILNGHSFRTEGTCPNSWTYMDGKYIQSVNNEFLKTDLSTFPNMTINRWLKWLHIQRLRPLYFMDYIKTEAKKELKEVGWVDYGEQHAENWYTKFVGYLWKHKFRQDLRYVTLSAQIRNGHMTRDEAFRILEQPVVCDESLIEKVKYRFTMTDDEFDDMMDQPVKSHKDYETYDFSKLKQVFEEFKDNLPQTFIDKYINNL